MTKEEMQAVIDGQIRWEDGVKSEARTPPLAAEHDHSGRNMDQRTFTDVNGVPQVLVTKRMPTGFAISAVGSTAEDATEALVTHMVRMLHAHGATRESIVEANTGTRVVGQGGDT